MSDSAKDILEKWIALPSGESMGITLEELPEFLEEMIAEVRRLRAQLAEHHKKHAYEMESHGEIQRAQLDEIRYLKKVINGIQLELLNAQRIATGNRERADVAEAELAKYKKAAQSIFDDPVGYMENKSVRWKDRAEKAEALLASGLHLPEVDLSGEIAEGRYYTLVEWPDGFRGDQIVAYERNQGGWRTGTEVIRALGPLKEK